MILSTSSYYENAFRYSPEYLNPIIILTLDSFLSCIELFSFINVFTTCVTSPVQYFSLEDLP